jgi:hypothetical protein
MDRKHRRLTIAGVVVAGLIAVGCGSGSTGDVNEGAAVAPADAGAATPGGKAKGGDKQVAQLGADTVSLPEGVVVAASKATKFKPASTAAGHTRGNTAFLVSITIENKGAEPLDLSLVTVEATVGKDGDRAEPVFDFEKKIDSSFRSKIASGRKQTAKFVWSTESKDLSLISLTVSPNLTEGTALFEGKL